MPVKSTVHIREATWDDLPDVARVHVQSWQQTYVGLIPQDYLDNLSVPFRLKKWQEVFHGDAVEGRGLFIACEGAEGVDGSADAKSATRARAISGLISFGPSRCQGSIKPGWGEIYAVYLLKESWGRGIGYALFLKARQHFLAQGMTNAYLWVLDTNAQARQAYVKWGGQVEPGPVKQAKIGGQDVTEVMMTFDLRRV